MLSWEKDTKVYMFIDGKMITYSYNGHAGTGKVLKNIDFNVHKGEFVAVLGCNGCGKSTLVKHLNGLIKIQSGKLVVDGIDVHDRCSLKQPQIRLCEH